MDRSGFTKGDEIRFRCPLDGHEDVHPSASWTPAKAAWYCHVCKVGGGAIDLAARLDVPRPERRTGPRPIRRTVATHIYRDAQSVPLKKVERYSPKGFAQFRPDGNDGWIPGIQDVPDILYRLDEVLVSPGPVFIAEGEACVDVLCSLGVTATTNAGGANKWRPEHTAQLGSKHVIVLPDNDEVGREHGQTVAREAYASGCSVKLLELPDLPLKGDIRDWVSELGHTRDDLLALVDKTPLWTPEDADTISGDRRDPEGLVIDAGNHDLAEVSAQAWGAIQQMNRPERLFRSGGIPVRVENDEDSPAPTAQTLTEDRLTYELARSATWFKTNRVGDRVAAAPPRAVVKDMLAAPVYPLPPLHSIVQAPVFAPDGSLQMEPGYHHAAKTLYVPMPGFEVPQISDVPTREEVERAKALIVDDLLGDFSFVGQAERANAVALMLDPFVRLMIDGPTPLRMIEAPSPGSGKGLLAAVVLSPAIGSRINLMSAANDDDEWRKRISAQLAQLPVAILMDNVTTALDSGSLSSALTTTWWSDRRLGSNDMIRAPIHCVWIATANNPTMSTEIARRTVRIRLDPNVDRPWQRTGFRHEDLRTWAAAQRSQLVWAALTLIRSWIVAGQPLGTARLGSFERWAAVQDGILTNARVPGFLANADEFYEASDSESAIWRQFIGLWLEQFNESEVGVAELFDLVKEVEGFDLGKGSDSAKRITLGIQLGQRRDRVIGDCRVEQTRVVKRVKRWRLVRAKPGRNPFNDIEAIAAEQDSKPGNNQ